MLSPAQANLLHAVDAQRDEMVALAAELVQIPSVGGSDAENEAQARMAEVLGDAGLEVDHWSIDLEALQAHPDFPGSEVDRTEAWGLVGRLPGTGGQGDAPTLMLNGHIDVVPPGDLAAWDGDPFSGQITGRHLRGRGSCDMKAGLVAAHWAVQALRASAATLRGDVLIASVQGEEDGGLGTFATLQRGWTADACVIPEPTDLDVVPANAGALTFRLHVRGKATHASQRTQGVSAIEKLWPIWRALEALEARRHQHVDPLADRWPLAHPISIGTVRAGDWASSVPDLLVAEGRIGVALDEDVAETRRQLEEAVAEASSGDPWLQEHPAEVEWWGGQFASARLPADSDLLVRTQAAHAAAAPGHVQQVWAAPYGSDLRLLVHGGGIPCLQYGPGDVNLAHSPHERVELEQVAAAARTLALLALDLCGGG